MILEINGRALAIDDIGSGEPLVLVHGLGGTANSWSPVVEAFRHSHRVVVLDLPGAGRSANDPRATIASLAADVLAVMEALGLSSAHLVGHSMGTITCQHLAASAPARVRDLVLLGPLAEPPDAARPALLARAESAQTDGMEAIADLICERGLAATTRARHPLVTGFVRELLQRQVPVAYAQHCRALAEAVRADATRVTCRALLISGTEDTTSPPASVAALEASLPKAQRIELPDCGHWTMLEQPAAVVAAMQRFYGA